MEKRITDKCKRHAKRQFDFGINHNMGDGSRRKTIFVPAE